MFRPNGGADVFNHFELDEAGRVRVWQPWLRREDLLWIGEVVSEGRIELSAAGDDDNRLVLLLERPAR